MWINQAEFTEIKPDYFHIHIDFYEFFLEFQKQLKNKGQLTQEEVYPIPSTGQTWRMEALNWSPWIVRRLKKKLSFLMCHPY